MPPDDTDGRDWSEAELDDWFENDFGGDSAFNDFFFEDGGSTLDPDLHPDLHFGLTAYRQLAYDDATESFDEAEPWPLLGHEAKMRFRRGWEDSLPMTESVIGDLAPYNALETLVPAQVKLGKRPRWIFVGGGFGILGLVLMVGFFLRSGDADDTAAAVPSETPVVEATPPSTEATVIDTAAPAGVSDVPFPTSWPYTATKTASIVPAPDFMTPTPVGAVLSWAFNVTESCQQEVCTYVTVIDVLMPDPLFPAPPETTWVVVDTGWSLDVTYLSTQSAYDDGTTCVIRHHDTFELTVTNEGSIPTAFTGTWVQASSLDLGASSGNIDLYCGEPWEVVDEWSLVGVTG